MLTARQLFHNVEESHKNISAVVCEVLMKLKVVSFSSTTESPLDRDREQLIIKDCIGDDATEHEHFDDAPTISDNISIQFERECEPKEKFYEKGTSTLLLVLCFQICVGVSKYAVLSTGDKALVLNFTALSSSKMPKEFSIYDVYVILQGNELQYPYEGTPSLWKTYSIGSNRRCSHQSLRLTNFLEAQFPAVKLINNEVVVFQEFRSTFDNTSLFCAWRELNPSVVCLWGTANICFFNDLTPDCFTK